MDIMQKFNLIFIDILGFELLAKEIEKEKGIEARKVREDFINVIDAKIDDLNEKNLIIGKKSDNDDWIIVIDDTNNVLELMSSVLDHNTGYKGYERVPLEIAIGKSEYDEWAKLDGRNIIYEDETIEYLKSNIIKEYRKQYKDKRGESIKETFIVITDSFFNELPTHYQKKCEQIVKSSFFSMPCSIIEKEKKITNFLMRLGQRRSDFSGYAINRVFVPPDEYDEIKNTLMDEKIVFITGIPGYGKTYTAIRLLWEYFENDYTPHWISGKDPKERAEVRDSLANIETVLKEKSIFYLEDPFGKTRYERRDDLKERINYILQSIENIGDSYVVITSRKDIFENFIEESYSKKDIEDFEHELNLIYPSYGTDRREKILEQWAIEKGCKWLEIEELRDFIVQSLNKNLPTPLSIYDFVHATMNKTDIDEIKKEIILNSETPTKAFADDICGLCDAGYEDRILFLSFMFILDYGTVDFIRLKYNKMKKDNYDEFDVILKKEYRVKRTGNFSDDAFDSTAFYTDSLLTFSHPSYSESIKYVIKDPKCKNILSDVLIHLSDTKRESIISSVSWTVATYYEDLPTNVKKLLFYFAEHPNPNDDNIDVGDIADAIMYNYEKLPSIVQYLIFTLADRDPWRISMCNYIDKLPDSKQKLLRDKLRFSMK